MEPMRKLFGKENFTPVYRCNATVGMEVEDLHIDALRSRCFELGKKTNLLQIKLYNYLF